MICTTRTENLSTNTGPVFLQAKHKRENTKQKKYVQLSDVKHWHFKNDKYIQPLAIRTIAAAATAAAAAAARCYKKCTGLTWS